jgi:hypothetical protein
MKAWVDISIPGRHAEQHRLDDAGTTIGSSSPAGIRLPGVSSLLAEHCSLRPQAEGCWVELIEHAREPFLYEGRPAREGLIAWGNDLYLGAVRITVHADLSKGAGKGPSPLLWVAGLVLPLVGLTFFFKPEADGAQGSAMTEPPALFGQMPACSEEKSGALGRAAVAEQVGRAKHERGVFVLEDAVEGVQLMREAAVCYALGDNQGASDRTLDDAEAWIDDLKYSFKRAQLDLDYGGGNIGLRLDAIARLSVLLRHAGPAADEFKAQLAQLRRNSVAEFAEMQEQEEKK